LAMLQIKQIDYNDKIKEKVRKGFAKHSFSQIGIDEFCDEIHFAIQDNSKFAGMISVKQVLGALWVKTLYIEEEYRRRGFGSMLIRHVIQFSKEKDLKFIFLETFSFQALEFYKKFGFFHEFTRDGYRNGASLHYLKKDLEY